MIVRESISFERGNNPKSVLDIGSKKYLIEQFRQLFMWDEENGREDNGLIYNVDFNRYGDLIAIGFDTKNNLPDSSRENIKYLRKLFKQFGLTDYINLSPVKVQHGVGAVYYAFNLSKVGEDLGMKSKRLWMQFGTEIIESDHVSHLFERSWYDAPPIDEPLPPIDESINFERGKDPKKAMEVGYFKDKNGRIIEIGDNVYVEGILEEDDFSDFQGMVDSFHGEYVTVRDMEGDYFDVEPHKLEIIRDYFTPDTTIGYTFTQDATLGESVNFERGRDPKRAMEVGIYDKLPRIVGGDYYMEGDEMRMGPKQIKAVLDDAFNPTEWEKDYGFHVVWPDGKEDYMFLEDIVKNPDIDYIASHGEIFDVAMKVYEGISFERGKDPKDKMRIGNKYYHELEIDGVYETRGRGIEPFTSYNSRLEGYDERTFFRNCEAGFFPMNIGVKPVGEDIVIPSDMLKELGIEQLVFNDEITELG